MCKHTGHVHVELFILLADRGKYKPMCKQVDVDIYTPTGTNTQRQSQETLGFLRSEILPEVKRMAA